MRDAERARLDEATSGVPWRRWGPYVAQRAWGTVREDYSADGDAWAYFPHEHARSRAYRWNEDGLAGICDDQQTLCLALALWNGRDAILKERIFGVTNAEGNHGEDAKEYWWYLDSTPTHSWMRWRYLYPHAAFPYDELVTGAAARSRLEPELELADTGVLAGGYWDVTLDFAKAAPDDVCVRTKVTNRGTATAELDVLAVLWFRNTWAWQPDEPVPVLRPEEGTIIAEHVRLGGRVLGFAGAPDLLFCDNETNTTRLWGVPGPPFPKDGIGDHVVHGSASVNPARRGTKAAGRFHLVVAPGETAELRWRLTDGVPDVGAGFEEVVRTREAEADEFYASLTPATASADEARVMRQAFAGMLWSKQFYHFDVDRWLDGDPGEPTPPASRLGGRNRGWRHLNNHDVISMPDTWEYPWYAAWDLAFHCVALAHVDPSFAKDQLVLLCREWFMHPNGQLPAYEWNFDDVNPPVHAWAALRVYEIDGRRDRDFLARVFHKLLLNFTWWVNRKDTEGNNVFQGGFLGLDNIGAFNRSELPAGGELEQSDGTAWMAMYSLNLLEIALTLAADDPTYEDLATKFFEHFTYIASAMNTQGLWDDEDGFYYDVMRERGGEAVHVRVRSMVGVIPLFAVTVLDSSLLDRLPDFSRRMRWFVRYKPQFAHVVEHIHVPGEGERRLLSIVSPDRLRRILGRLLDEDEFLSPHGLRALSRDHRDHPVDIEVGGARWRVDYEPGESSSGLFGGNSNWRGPVWMPLNYLVIEALTRYARYVGNDYLVELPTGSGHSVDLDAAADDLARRLIGLFLPGSDGRRPLWGAAGPPDGVGDDLLFFEYFHGDTGAGLGASHQTGWTGLVADLVRRTAGGSA